MIPLKRLGAMAPIIPIDISEPIPVGPDGSFAVDVNTPPINSRIVALPVALESEEQALPAFFDEGGPFRPTTVLGGSARRVPDKTALVWRQLRQSYAVKALPIEVDITDRDAVTAAFTRVHADYRRYLMLRPPGFPTRLPVTRIEAFVDAAFAFAVTLLVISFDAIPDSVPALLEALKGVPAFAASFALLAMFWWAHASWSRKFGLDDGRSVLLSLVLVFLVLVYVYPLRIIFGSFLSFLTGGWLPSPLEIHAVDELRPLFLAYALAWTMLGGVVVALYRHAWRLRDRLQLSVQERVSLRGMIAAQWMIPATGLVALFRSKAPAGSPEARIRSWAPEALRAATSRSRTAAR